MVVSKKMTKLQEGPHPSFSGTASARVQLDDWATVAVIFHVTAFVAAAIVEVFFVVATTMGTTQRALMSLLQ